MSNITYLPTIVAGGGTVTSVSGGVGIVITGNPAVNPTVNLIVPVTVPHGGTGNTSWTAYAPLVGGTVSTNPLQSAATGMNNVNYVFTSNGAGALPSWKTFPGGGNVVGPASSTDRAIATWNGAGGDLLFDNPTIKVTAIGDLTMTGGNINVPNTNGAGTTGIITFGGNPFISNFGGTNTFVGQSSGNTTLTGFSNAAFGSDTLSNITTGTFNSANGYFSQNAATTGDNNSSIGAGSLSSATGAASGNTAIGSGALNSAVTPNNNIALGFDAASAYTTNESNNIIVGTTGVIGESATMRLGDFATQTSTYVAGIAGVNVGSVATVVSIATGTGKLGQTTITAGANITVTPGPNSITIAANTGSETISITPVVFGQSPYTVLTTDYFLAVDVTGGAITILLPNAPTTGTSFVIKDVIGSASTKNITVTTVGGVVNIDGSTSAIMNSNYESINVTFNGTSYMIF